MLTQDREFSTTQYFLIHTLLCKVNIIINVQNTSHWTQHIIRLFETEILLSLRRLEIHECYQHGKLSAAINSVWYENSVKGTYYVSGDHANYIPIE
jgi:hypothetical protein